MIIANQTLRLQFMNQAIDFIEMPVNLGVLVSRLPSGAVWSQ